MYGCYPSIVTSYKTEMDMSQRDLWVWLWSNGDCFKEIYGKPTSLKGIIPVYTERDIDSTKCKEASGSKVNQPQPWGQIYLFM